jgi:hypothetical protein
MIKEGSNFIQCYFLLLHISYDKLTCKHELRVGVNLDFIKHIKLIMITNLKDSNNIMDVDFEESQGSQLGSKIYY